MWRGIAWPAGLAGLSRLDPAEFLSPTKIPGVDLLDLSPMGGTPGDLTRATLGLVNALSQRVDVVVIDTPPLAVTTEALEFVPVATVVVLVGRLGRTPTASAERAGELIRFGGAEHLAIALTDTGSGSLRRTSYYDYYQADDRVGSESRRKAPSGGKRRRSRSSRDDGGDALVDDGGLTPPDEAVPASASRFTSGASADSGH